MNEFPRPFFLSEEAGLYGCLHGEGGSPRTGVLCVQPLFGEYIQHHRAFFVFAERLARSGIPCLRYDHHATGDSADDLPQATLARWLRDVELMAATLVQATGVGRIVLVGARFGATLALGAVARIARASGLVLWEPLWSGGEFLESQLRTHREFLAPCLPPEESGGEAGSIDLLGFDIPRRLWNEIAAFDPDGGRLPPDLDVLLLGSPGALAGSGGCLPGHERLFRQPVQHPREWLEPERGMYDVLVPAEVMGHLTRWIGARS